MARIYSDEKFRLDVLPILRKYGHDVLTAFEAGNANQKIPDEAVLQFAIMEKRAILTLYRRHFIKLHKQSTEFLE
jgi:Domain of unknown function (DUF5615)